MASHCSLGEWKHHTIHPGKGKAKFHLLKSDVVISYSGSKKHSWVRGEGGVETRKIEVRRKEAQARRREHIPSLGHLLMHTQMYAGG